MVCQACGAPLEAGVRFCPRCGTAVEQPPAPGGYPASPPPGPGQTSPPPYNYAGAVVAGPRPRVVQHVRTLGILWVVFGVYRVASGLFGIFLLSAITSHRLANWGIPFPAGRGFPPAWLGFMGPLIEIGTFVAAGLAFATAYGLLNRTSWGRVVALIAAVIALIKFPFGTALGIYTLWVLAPAVSAAEYERLSATSGN